MCFLKRRRQEEYEEMHMTEEQVLLPSTRERGFHPVAMLRKLVFPCVQAEAGTSREAEGWKEGSEAHNHVLTPRPLGFKRRLFKLLGYQGRPNRVTPL